MAVGWSNVPYLGPSLMVDQALANCLSSVDAVFMWSAGLQAYSWWFKGAPAASTLASLSGGVAVWVDASAPCNWMQT